MLKTGDVLVRIEDGCYFTITQVNEHLDGVVSYLAINSMYREVIVYSTALGSKYLEPDETWNPPVDYTGTMLDPVDEQSRLLDL